MHDIPRPFSFDDTIGQSIVAMRAANQSLGAAAVVAVPTPAPAARFADFVFLACSLPADRRAVEIAIACVLKTFLKRRCVTGRSSDNNRAWTKENQNQFYNSSHDRQRYTTCYLTIIGGLVHLVIIDTILRLSVYQL